MYGFLTLNFKIMLIQFYHQKFFWSMIIMNNHLVMIYIKSLQKYTVTVSEDKVYPYQIASVFARDLDSGSYSEIQYSLSGQGHEKFMILKSVSLFNRLIHVYWKLFITDSETKIQMYRISLGENGTQIHVSRDVRFIQLHVLVTRSW